MMDDDRMESVLQVLDVLLVLMVSARVRSGPGVLRVRSAVQSHHQHPKFLPHLRTHLEDQKDQ
jgi:hypothetical protein